MFKLNGYIVKFINVWGEPIAKFRFICESNSAKYTMFFTEEELKNEPLWKPRVYATTKAAELAIKHIPGYDELNYKIIPIELIYKEVDTNEGN